MKPYEVMFQLFDSIKPMSTLLKKALKQNTKLLEYPAKHKLFKEGDVAHTAYFMAQGLARTYYYRDGIQQTNNLCPENRIFISSSSFYKQTPSLEYGELLEDSILIAINNSTMERLCAEFPELNYNIRKLVEMFYVILDQRTYWLHAKNTMERYEYMTNNYPDLFNRIPLKIIASFLNMSPETLSRMRKIKNS